jgi:hypothetical protein
MNRAPEVRLKQPLEILDLNLLKWSINGHSSVIDDDRDTSVLTDDFLATGRKGRMN